MNTKYEKKRQVFAMNTCNYLLELAITLLYILKIFSEETAKIFVSFIESKHLLAHCSP